MKYSPVTFLKWLFNIDIINLIIEFDRGDITLYNTQIPYVLIRVFDINKFLQIPKMSHKLSAKDLFLKPSRNVEVYKSGKVNEIVNKYRAEELASLFAYIAVVKGEQCTVVAGSYVLGLLDNDVTAKDIDVFTNNKNVLRIHNFGLNAPEKTQFIYTKNIKCDTNKNYGSFIVNTFDIDCSSWFLTIDIGNCSNLVSDIRHRLNLNHNQDQYAQLIFQFVNGQPQQDNSRIYYPHLDFEQLLDELKNKILESQIYVYGTQGAINSLQTKEAKVNPWMARYVRVYYRAKKYENRGYSIHYPEVEGFLNYTGTYNELNEGSQSSVIEMPITPDKLLFYNGYPLIKPSTKFLDQNGYYINIVIGLTKPTLDKRMYEFLKIDFSPSAILRKFETARELYFEGKFPKWLNQYMKILRTNAFMFMLMRLKSYLKEMGYYYNDICDRELAQLFLYPGKQFIRRYVYERFKIITDSDVEDIYFHKHLVPYSNEIELSTSYGNISLKNQYLPMTPMHFFLPIYHELCNVDVRCMHNPPIDEIENNGYKLRFKHNYINSLGQSKANSPSYITQHFIHDINNIYKYPQITKNILEAGLMTDFKDKNISEVDFNAILSQLPDFLLEFAETTRTNNDIDYSLEQLPPELRALITQYSGSAEQIFKDKNLYLSNFIIEKINKEPERLSDTGYWLHPLLLNDENFEYLKNVFSNLLREIKGNEFRYIYSVANQSNQDNLNILIYLKQINPEDCYVVDYRSYDLIAIDFKNIETAIENLNNNNVAVIINNNESNWFGRIFYYIIRCLYLGYFNKLDYAIDTLIFILNEIYFNNNQHFVIRNNNPFQGYVSIPISMETRLVTSIRKKVVNSLLGVCYYISVNIGENTDTIKYFNDLLSLIRQNIRNEDLQNRETHNSKVIEELHKIRNKSYSRDQNEFKEIVDNTLQNLNVNQ